MKLHSRRCHLRSNEWVLLLKDRASPRFEIEVGGDRVDELIGLAAKGLDADVLRLRRPGAPGCRTLLVACGADAPEETARAALRWAADVRDALPEPEPADLYLFLDTPLQHDIGARIEADDRFCRRFVVRAKEPPEDLLDRTFLATMTESNPSEAPSDPLSDAFKALPEVPASWRAALLGETRGGELAEDLVCLYAEVLLR